jgi:hypothetical protein
LHRNGSCCPKCCGKNKTTQYFINESVKIHGNTFDYKLVNYVLSKNKVKIICKTHGIFLQTPSDHLSGNGCAKCSGRNKTTEDFINESIKIHGKKYDYSKTIYNSCIEKVIIICKKHGEFLQTPDKNLQGHGCSKCYSKYSKSQITWLNFISK